MTEHAGLETIAEALGERSALLVLDNCEHCTAPAQSSPICARREKGLFGETWSLLAHLPRMSAFGRPLSRDLAGQGGCGRGVAWLGEGFPGAILDEFLEAGRRATSDLTS